MISIRAVWPKQIAIPRQVGKDSYHTSAGRPVCAVGYAYQEFGRKPGLGRWKTRYVEIATKLNLCYSYDTVEGVNDRLRASVRIEMYLMTWASFGYTVGMPANIVKKVRKLGYKV